jgi:hypothetical protein
MTRRESVLWVVGVVLLWGAVAGATDAQSAMVHVAVDGHQNFAGAAVRLPVLT